MEMNTDIQIDTNFYKVHDIRFLTDTAFIVQFPRRDFSFKAGQHISLSVQDDFQSREYSIYSAEASDYLEVLVKEVEGGYFSPKLKHLKRGDMVEIHGPFGRFVLNRDKLNTHQHIFIASGTGIAPFHSIIHSNPGIDYRLIHGVRFGDEAYEKESYADDRYLLCTSRDDSGDYHGRLTGYLREAAFDRNSCFYLCGNSDMIFDAMDILKSKGFDRNDVTVEVYF